MQDTKDQPGMLALARRSFLKLTGVGVGMATLTASTAGAKTSFIENYGAPSDGPSILPRPSDAYLLLNRTSFGVTSVSLAKVQEMGLSEYLEQQLDYESIDTTGLENLLDFHFPYINQDPLELGSKFPGDVIEITKQMTAATQYRQMYSERQLYEVMVEFWTNHFNIDINNGFGPILKPKDDREVIRKHALGNFGDLLFASARSPAMLFYLDNYYNVAAAPNENYARELMELHTLGVDGGYTEQDIKEVARCFTGWSIGFPGSGPDEGKFLFYSDAHDNGEKRVLGQRIRANGGVNDGLQVLGMLTAHPATANHIATKLCRHFIADEPDTATVEEVASAFSSSNGEIKDTLRALFNSSAFRKSYDKKFTTPSQFLGRIMRIVMDASGSYPRDNGQMFNRAQLLLGQLPFIWPSPDGYPQTQAHWSNTGALLNRWRLSFLLAFNGGLETPELSLDWNLLMGNANSIEELLVTMETGLLCREMLREDRENISQWLSSLAGEAPDSSLSRDVLVQLAPALAAILMSSAYFQMR